MAEWWSIHRGPGCSGAQSTIGLGLFTPFFHCCTACWALCPQEEGYILERGTCDWFMNKIRITSISTVLDTLLHDTLQTLTTANNCYYNGVDFAWLWCESLKRWSQEASPFNSRSCARPCSQHSNGGLLDERNRTEDQTPIEQASIEESFA